MRHDRRSLVAMAAAAALVIVLLTLFGAAAGALVWSALSGPERASLGARLAQQVPGLLLLVLLIAAASAAAAQPLYRRWVHAPARLLEQARMVVATDTGRDLTAPDGGASLQGLAECLSTLAQQRDGLRCDITQQVAQASQRIEQERNQLAALMSELTQSVVVCNLDGRILLFNQRARMQFRALAPAPALADGRELIGLGRSIYDVFDRKLVAHALEHLQLRLRRGAPHPTAQFVTTTRSGQLLRAQMAPVRDTAGPTDDEATHTIGPAETQALTGFVLMLDNITVEYEHASAHERLLHGLIEGSRSSLATLSAAAERLDDAGQQQAPRRQLLGSVREAVRSMSRRIDALAAQSTEGLAARWPLDEMFGADFVHAAQRRIEAAGGLNTQADEVDATLWLRLDSFALLQAMAYLALRLRDECGVAALRLRLAAVDTRRARLDLVWTGQAMRAETALAWEREPISTGREASALTLRDVMQRHAGSFGFERDEGRDEACFRFLLPRAPSAAGPERLDAESVRAAVRAEFYDFDLFATTESSRTLDERPLEELSYTVFDTETTGLDPSGGDEIIQIGAARIVNGRLLRDECFDQLVDPKRPISQASIAVHGITPAMVAGQPDAVRVLPAFHAYARDTVLVAHNAAFDMRLLQLKEERIGVRFDQPVLDTLLLSAVLQPNQDSHRLEAIAERFGIEVAGRHTALGDALVTAEVFRKLMPLLAERGIRTLGEARAAAQRSYYARLKY